MWVVGYDGQRRAGDTELILDWDFRLRPQVKVRIGFHRSCFAPTAEHLRLGSIVTRLNCIVGTDLRRWGCIASRGLAQKWTADFSSRRRFAWPFSLRNLCNKFMKEDHGQITMSKLSTFPQTFCDPEWPISNHCPQFPDSIFSPSSATSPGFLSQLSFSNKGGLPVEPQAYRTVCSPDCGAAGDSNFCPENLIPKYWRRLGVTCGIRACSTSPSGRNDDDR